MNKTVKLTLFLAIISALATGVLAAVNSVTAPIIAANEAGAQTAEIEKLYPYASSFEAIEFEADADGLVREAYKVDEDAYVFQVAARGYDDDIVFLIGYDVDGSNSKFQILSNNDTPGFGQRLMEDEYHQGMTGKSTSDPVDMISGVTASSDAIKNGVDAAVTVFNSLTGSTATPEEVEPDLPQVSTADLVGDTITSTNQEGDVMTYVVESVGYVGTNEYEIKIDLATGSIESVIFTQFNDTVGLGDKADSPEFLGQFEGLNINEMPSEVDGVSGATKTVESVIKAVNLAVEDARNQE
ncbi:MAG TPA: FMN-binding protein [Erysipelothrix sp.]|nr:FMN-binding protein [Erysipelothrix sp.]